jgi:hypothetical protein
MTREREIIRGRKKKSIERKKERKEGRKKERKKEDGVARVRNKSN